VYFFIGTPPDYDGNTGKQPFLSAWKQVHRETPDKPDSRIYYDPTIHFTP
jgi:hypothetical protein